MERTIQLADDTQRIVVARHSGGIGIIRQNKSSRGDDAWDATGSVTIPAEQVAEVVEALKSA